MTTKELKAEIEKTYGMNKLQRVIESEGLDDNEDELNTIVGLPFKIVVEGERDYSNFFYIFQIGEKFYQWDGYYDSWNGTDMSDFDGFYEVEKKTKTVEYWKKVKQAKP